LSFNELEELGRAVLKVSDKYRTGGAVCDKQVTEDLAPEGCGIECEAPTSTGTEPASEYDLVCGTRTVAYLVDDVVAEGHVGVVHDAIHPQPFAGVNASARYLGTR
jgi:hypothetical protein